MNRLLLALLAAAAAAAVAACEGPPAGSAVAADVAPSPAAPIERGRYLVAIMDCAACHNQGSFGPQPAAGYLEGAEVGHEVPELGVFYPPTLTPHPEAGLGRWSEADIVDALRTGRRPDGRELSPAMPWRSYAALTDADAQAIAAYLRSLPPSAHRSPAPATAETAPRPYLTMRTP